MPYSPILATLGYVFSPDREKVLMVHRTARPGDLHDGKWNGLGGKLEANEDIVSGMRREIREEAGIECGEVQLAGTISWPGFGKNGEDFTVAYWFYLRRGYTGAWREIMHKGSGNSERTFAMWMRADSDRLYYRLSTTSSYDEGGSSFGGNTLLQVAFGQLDPNVSVRRIQISYVAQDFQGLPRLTRSGIGVSNYQVLSTRLYD